MFDPAARLRIAAPPGVLGGSSGLIGMVPKSGSKRSLLNQISSEVEPVEAAGAPATKKKKVAAEAEKKASPKGKPKEKGKGRGKGRGKGKGRGGRKGKGRGKGRGRGQAPAPGEEADTLADSSAEESEE